MSKKACKIGITIGHRVRPETIREIAIRAPNWIGDAIMSLPAISATRRIFPDSRITILCNGTVSRIYEQNPDVDEILAKNSKSRLEGAFIAKPKFDMALIMTNTFKSAFMATLAGIPVRVGYDRKRRGVMLTHKISGVGKHDIHQADYYLKLLETVAGGRVEGGGYKLKATGDENKMAEKLIRENGGDLKKKLAGICFGATFGMAKQWPYERFAAIADRLIGLGFEVLLTGGPSERDAAELVIGKMKKKPVDLVGKTSIGELIAVIGRCGVYVSNDSGPMHIASVLDVPTVAIFGPTDMNETLPRTGRVSAVGVNADCAPCWQKKCPTDHRCMLQIDVDDVWKEIEKITG